MDEGQPMEAYSDMPAAVGIGAFLGEFKANEVQAGLKYLGKPVRLAATISALGKTADGSDYLILADDLSQTVVKCTLVPGTSLSTQNFSVGDAVTVQGFFEGKTEQLNIGFCTVSAVKEQLVN